MAAIALAPGPVLDEMRQKLRGAFAAGQRAQPGEVLARLRQVALLRRLLGLQPLQLRPRALAFGLGLRLGLEDRLQGGVDPRQMRREPGGGPGQRAQSRRRLIAMQSRRRGRSRLKSYFCANESPGCWNCQGQAI